MSPRWERELAELDAYLDDLAQALQVAALIVDLAEIQETNPPSGVLAQQVRRALRAVESLRAWRADFKRKSEEATNYSKG
ncbi:MAG: hypothetical protein KatS3mg007_1646 [Thermoanaerobaculum sp.]|nr:MAG: hypothetical protein KatS3mg007_1646 [Thermoanaerobaculum sp.]